ncbi:uncharacterized protein [Rutidosis leptorrhynchoides]|uniref:uncharacterized protein n=1 Tax=Rutidosis leptorrhynchoides TaxID=125765 RepID=UPI003A9A32EF
MSSDWAGFPPVHQLGRLCNYGEMNTPHGKLKMVVDLLKGIHFVSSLEAVSLGVQAGLHPWIIYDIISNAAGNSWVFKHYIPYLLQGKQIEDNFLNALAQRSLINDRKCYFDAIYLGTVLDTAKSLTFPLPLLAAAHQQILAALSEKLYVIKGGCGAGSGVKMVNQLLAGVHIASAAEAMAFGARLGLDTKILFNYIKHSEGTSWMFENRGPHMVDNDYTPLSALDIFVKDLGIVARECASRRVPLHISTVAPQLFLSGSASGWGRLDDSAVVKTLVVLDDDPTGTQTVHDVDVLTEWNVESLVEQLKSRPKCFFILTNSRALSSDKASALITEICQNLSTAAMSVGNNDYTVLKQKLVKCTNRSNGLKVIQIEPNAAVSVLGEMDAWVICPFFLQGGRFTIEDVHYVADADRLIPAGDTEFAKDASFGYKSSNLREWVEVKTGGRIPASSVSSVSIQLLRNGGPTGVYELLCSLKKGSTCIVNSASDRDMAVFAAGMIQAESKGKRFLCRTAASFVYARIGIIAKAPILPNDLGISKGRSGGLIVVGSYVPKTTEQKQIEDRGCSIKEIKTVTVFEAVAAELVTVEGASRLAISGVHDKDFGCSIKEIKTVTVFEAVAAELVTVEGASRLAISGVHDKDFGL